MKKLFILTSVLALGALGAMAQGEINAANNGQGSLIYIAASSTSTAYKVGSPATANGFTTAGSGAVSVSIYASPSGTSLQALEASTPVYTGFNSTVNTPTFAGTEPGPNPLVLPSPYDGSAAVEFIVYAQTAGGTYSAWSSETTLVPAQNGAPSVPAIFGSTGGLIGNFTLLPPAPEPSTLALGGLGAAALLMFRRRK